MPGVEAPFTLGAPGQPASEWRPGDLVQQFVSLRAPADLPAGDYEFRIRFGGGPPTVFFPVEIRESERRFRPAPGGTALGLAFGQVAELSSWRAEGYDGTPASGPVTAAQGGPVTWLLDWRALGTPPVNYAVSVQALDHQGRVAGQADEHLRPDSASWVAGQYVSSRHQFGVAAAGDYRVIAVLYDPATGQRVRLADGRDFAELTTLRVCAGATSRC
jgi:hypothetical protein